MINPQKTTLPLNIVGGSAFGRYAKISTEQTFNMMISDNALVPYPGYKKKVALNGGVGREIYGSTKYKHLIAVVDNNVFTIDPNFAVAKVGELETFSGQVYIAENANQQIGIADGLNLYTFNYGSNTFTQASIDFLPGFLAYQDGYGIAASKNTNQWRLSAPNNFDSWPDDAPNVGALQSKVDNVMATVPFTRSLMVFGKIVTEQWYDTGGQLFPYQRNNFYNIDYGTINASSIATGAIQQQGQQLTPIIAWVGINEKSGPAIMYSMGGEPMQASFDGLNYRLEQLTAPEDVYGFMFKEAGHVIYQVTWPTDNYSIAVDFTVQKFYTLTDEKLNYHIAKRVAYFNNAYYFLSFNDGDLYQVSSQFNTYNGAEIPRIRIPAPLRLPDSSRFVLNNVTLTMEQGDFDAPQRVDLSLSDDGGITFGTTVGQELNGIAQRPNQFQFWNCGSGNDLRLQFHFWGSPRFVITNGSAEVYQ